MGMACTRVIERVLVSIGDIKEVPSIFSKMYDVPNGGVLWAIPALLANGLLRHTKIFFALPKGFYSVVQIFLLLAFMALSRVKTIERLKYEPVGEWGNLLGLDRIPEVRTLREKITILSRAESSVKEWSATVSKEWMEASNDMAGILYIDGHVRVYYGSQTKLPRRYLSRQRLCLRGTTDYWVNDKEGKPFFVISTPLTPGLIQMIKDEIVPRLLKDIPNQPSQKQLESDPYLMRFSLVFDREGYSPKSIKELWDTHRISILTYHKFPKEDWPVDEFEEKIVKMPNGEEVKMKLAERGTYIGDKKNGIWIREIRRLTDTGHQTSVLSTDYKNDFCHIAVHMFSRWSQENFFKYMMEHYNIDALLGYKLEGLDDTKKVVNPKYRDIEGKIKKEAGRLGRKMAKFAEITLKPAPLPKEVEKYERKKGELKESIDLLKNSLESLKEKRKITPKHIELGELMEDDRFFQISSTKKQFHDMIKMIAYRAETALVSVVREVIVKLDDARSLIREILTTEADIIPDDNSQTITIQLHHLANPLSDRIANHIADHLNETENLYPGTNLRMIFKLVSK